MKVGIFGGGFKPFTTGHFSKLSLALAENDFVVLYYALAARTKGSDFVFTKEMASDVYDVVKPALERTFGSKISVQLGQPTPIVRIFKAIEDAAMGTTGELSQLGIDPDSIEKLTIYSDPTDLKRFTKYIGSDKEEKYFGNLVKSERIRFDSGLSDDDDTDISRMASAMRSIYPDLSDEDLEDLITVRGSDVRATIGTRDRDRIARYLPDFLTDEEKDEIIAILMRGLPIEEGIETLRTFIRTLING